MFQNSHQTVLISMKIGLIWGSFSKRFTIQRKLIQNKQQNDNERKSINWWKPSSESQIVIQAAIHEN